ncbi:hypothetical protein AVEN_275046-1 [Araneus ventricosus]|uniref:Uncharacterized protein n=1 Tax=Araneus ventricosus TaxID=182803 RepID=A0A4Y2ETV1_ARAVE|nr:hypothetical protein AVEN_275046-1 [Araneus ventricosus]
MDRLESVENKPVFRPNGMDWWSFKKTFHNFLLKNKQLKISKQSSGSTATPETSIEDFIYSETQKDFGSLVVILANETGEETFFYCFIRESACVRSGGRVKVWK